MKAARARLRAGLALALLTLWGTGCLPGLLYTHVTRPLDVNFDASPVQGDRAASSQKTLEYYVRVDWGNIGIADIAKQHGFAKIHYADLETLSVLGIYHQRWVHVYGERAP